MACGPELGHPTISVTRSENKLSDQGKHGGTRSLRKVGSDSSTVGVGPNPMDCAMARLKRAGFVPIRRAEVENIQ